MGVVVDSHKGAESREVTLHSLSHYVLGAEYKYPKTSRGEVRLYHYYSYRNLLCVSSVVSEVVTQGFIDTTPLGRRVTLWT